MLKKFPTFSQKPSISPVGDMCNGVIASNIEIWSKIMLIMHAAEGCVGIPRDFLLCPTLFHWKLYYPYLAGKSYNVFSTHFPGMCYFLVGTNALYIYIRYTGATLSGIFHWLNMLCVVYVYSFITLANPSAWPLIVSINAISITWHFRCDRVLQICARHKGKSQDIRSVGDLLSASL